MLQVYFNSESVVFCIKLQAGNVCYFQDLNVLTTPKDKVSQRVTFSRSVLRTLGSIFHPSDA